jgi:lipoprotein-releasing system ATP-binding protein
MPPPHDRVTAHRDCSDLHTSPVVIETQGLQKTYFGKVVVPVLFGIYLCIRAGEFVAIMGQSGSGKSTLLNILGALDVPTGGTVLINGIDISMLDDDAPAALRSEDIGSIFQFHRPLDEYTCLEHALLPLIIRHGSVSEPERTRVVHLLQRVGLGHRLENHPDAMSGGENQRGAIVRALANAPRIVLADEPTGDLDSRSGQDVFALMREMNREIGVAFLMLTHDDRPAQAVDRILPIEDGRIREIRKAAPHL